MACTYSCARRARGPRATRAAGLAGPHLRRVGEAPAAPLPRALALARRRLRGGRRCAGRGLAGRRCGRGRWRRGAAGAGGRGGGSAGGRGVLGGEHGQHGRLAALQQPHGQHRVRVGGERAAAGRRRRRVGGGLGLVRCAPAQGSSGAATQAARGGGGAGKRHGSVLLAARTPARALCRPPGPWRGRPHQPAFTPRASADPQTPQALPSARPSRTAACRRCLSKQTKFF
jgi:hypothetical protein